MPTYPRDDESYSKPIDVRIVNDVQTAPIERRTNMATFVPSATPTCILPYSNKRIHAIINVVATGTGNTGFAFFTKDQADALQVSATYNAGSIIGPGQFEVVGTGEFWLVASGATNFTVGVISEYEI
jgi:hypothetical protein